VARRVQLSLALAAAGAACLVAWVVSVAGATGWSLTTNWILFGAGLGLAVASSRA
jgi:hypothetical protein